MEQYLYLVIAQLINIFLFVLLFKYIKNRSRESTHEASLIIDKIVWFLLFVILFILSIVFWSPILQAQSNYLIFIITWIFLITFMLLFLFRKSKNKWDIISIINNKNFILIPYSPADNSLMQKIENIIPWELIIFKMFLIRGCFVNIASKLDNPKYIQIAFQVDENFMTLYPEELDHYTSEDIDNRFKFYSKILYNNPTAKQDSMVYADILGLFTKGSIWALPNDIMKELFITPYIEKSLYWQQLFIKQLLDNPHLIKFNYKNEN